MQSNRITNIQMRAKRRILALAIVATAFAGYGTLSILAQEDRAIQLPIEKLSIAPGVKAVGIRLINSNPKLPTAALPLPATFPSATLSPATFPPATFPPAQLPNAVLPQPTGSESMLPVARAKNDSPDATPEFVPQPTFTSISAPPRMSDVLPALPAGKVVMKLNGGDSAVNTLPSDDHTPPTESVDIRVVQTRSMGKTSKMPPFIFEQSAKKVDAGKEAASSAAALPLPLQSSARAIRMSFADGVESFSVTSPKVRAPQLIKPKRTQLEHTVTLAHSTEIESRQVYDEPEVNVPSVEVDASLVPFAISGTKSYNKSKGNGPQAVVTDAVSDAFVALAPPARELQIDSQPGGNKVKSLGADPNVDRSRRKFDARPANQIPIASVDLECLAATAMDLPGKLVAIAVQDENVCKALHNERTVSLVGNQPGTTLVQIWTEDLGDKPQVIKVNVAQQGGKYQATATEVRDINQLISHSFPRANVSIVSKEDGGIEVAGTTESEETARRILELVRKLYLVPVKDKLIVSK